MQSKIIVTGDNSKTLLIPSLNETYHSTNGAIRETQHVFIREGLAYSALQDLYIFEMGFGTGLNAITTFLYSKKSELKIQYDCIESNPIPLGTALKMDYPSQLNSTKFSKEFEQIHKIQSEKEIALSNGFRFRKFIARIQDQVLEPDNYDLIYFDAFGPKIQPELWEDSIILKMSHILKRKGILVTYCAQGAFQRRLKKFGFEVQKIQGPPGKREMTRAIKK